MDTLILNAVCIYRGCCSAVDLVHRRPTVYTVPKTSIFLLVAWFREVFCRLRAEGLCCCSPAQVPVEVIFVFKVSVSGLLVEEHTSLLRMCSFSNVFCSAGCHTHFVQDSGDLIVKSLKGAHVGPMDRGLIVNVRHMRCKQCRNASGPCRQSKGRANCRARYPSQCHWAKFIRNSSSAIVL